MKIEDFEYIGNTIDNGIIILDKDLKVYFWNEWLERRSNISYKDIKNNNLKDFFPNLNESKLKRKISTSLSLNSPTFYNTEINKFLLDIKCTNLTSKVFENMQQAITITPYNINESIVFVYIYDNTLLCESNFKLSQVSKDLENKNIDLLESQDKLKRSYSEIELLLNTTMEAIFLFENNICTRVNQKAIELFSYNSENEIINQLLEDLIIAPSINIKDTLLNKEFEINILKKDKKEFTALIKIKNISLKQKNIKVITILDITELKVKDKLLAEQSKMAAMGEMIENIAHQWRQPLSTISTAASGIRMQKDLGMLKDETFYNSTTMIVKSAKYLSQTIDDFKNFILGDKEKVFFNVDKNLKKNLSLLDAILKTNQINIVYESDENIEIFNYPNELTQSIINIVTNAKDALVYENIKNKYIFISVYIYDNKLCIEIKDNANGIKKENITKVFEPYFTTKHKKQGTGLGLYMTHQLIEVSMKGSISLDNEEYTYKDEVFKGACFKILLDL